MRKGFVKSDDPAAASGIDPEVALYYRKKMLPKSLPGLWDKMMKRVYAAGAKLSIAVVAVVFSGMLACAIVIVSGPSPRSSRLVTASPSPPVRSPHGNAGPERPFRPRRPQAVIVANWPREAVHHFFLENHARALAVRSHACSTRALKPLSLAPGPRVDPLGASAATPQGLPETTYKEALRQARYLPWGGPQPRCSAARDALMSGGNVAAALASAEGDAYGAGAGGGGGGGGVSDAGAVGEESARRSLLRQRRALLSRGAGAWRTDELDPEEWAGLLLPSAESRRAMLDFLYSRVRARRSLPSAEPRPSLRQAAQRSDSKRMRASRALPHPTQAVTCPFRTKDCTSNAKVSSAMPDVPLGSWGSCAVR